MDLSLFHLLTQDVLSVSNDKIPPHSFSPQQGQVLPPFTPRISWVAERPLILFQINTPPPGLFSPQEKKTFVNLASALNRDETTLQAVYS